MESFKGPGDVQGRVIPEDRPVSGGVVGVSGFVENFGGVREDEKAVGEAFRDPEKLNVVTWSLGFEMESCPFAEVRRVASKIDGDVPDMA